MLGGEALAAGGFRLYTDDISDLDLSGTQYGKRGVIFYLSGKGEKEGLRVTVLHAGVLILGVTLLECGSLPWN